ncbi:hypothetical protein MHF_0680 [Mycoplasma haemofelis Ohio2]|uniref:Uncharacterized protein n=1 Tax=Mycoplasma haemofelis (strain Ohio2) TaxID=859194 RepID=F6FIA2_MYCHI|nr:hypothetical protein MHF_0680 [Mycoplasma haemofelis Ohio2]
MLDWFSKLLLGGSVLAGTGVTLGISALTAAQLKDTEEPKELNLTSISEEDTDISEPKPESLKISTPKVEVTEVKTPAKVRVTRQAKPKGCTIHQLSSSSGRTWKISKIGTWEEFLKEKAGKGERVNTQTIQRRCDEAKGKDILVVNSWWGWNRRWDYSSWEQNHQQFKSYLANSGRS